MDYKYVFERPHMNDFPKVFKQIECKSKQDPSKSIKIKIQEVPIELHEEIISFMVQNYLPDEPLARTTKLIEDQISTEMYMGLFQLVLLQNVSVVALTDDDDGKTKIIGCQLYTVTSLDDPERPKVDGIAINKLKDLLINIYNEDIIKNLNIYQYLSDWGLCVSPEYRNWGIGEEILKIGIDLGKHIGINTIITVFTVINSQVLAYRIGYKVLNEIKYKEYKDESGNLIFPGEEDTEAIKLMILKF